MTPAVQVGGVTSADLVKAGHLARDDVAQVFEYTLFDTLSLMAYTLREVTPCRI